MPAARGYAALAACWISEAEAAEAIASVPLERFLRSVQVLAGRPEVDASRTTAMALSRGAEGLLAAMSTADAVPCLLLLSGTEDVVWPAEQMAAQILDRRPAGSGDRHLTFRGAGHLIRLGVLPTDAQWTGGVAFGGEPDTQADAQRAATAAVSDFLGAAVTADRAPTT